MLHGHGDDLYLYPDIRINFSSNVYNHFSHAALFSYLSGRLEGVVNYPDPTPRQLEQELAGEMGLTPSQVMVTNGATEAIYLVAQTCRDSRSSILVPTFSEYADACRMQGHDVRFIRSLTQLDDAPSHLCWLCNPNNPTGQVFDKEILLNVIKSHADVLFVIDASYAVFTRQPLLTAAEAVLMPNVLLLHSMTKEFAIPGLRLGYLTGASALLHRIARQRMPWSVNRLAQDAGSYLIRHRSDYQLPLDTLLAERQRMATQLQQLGLTTWPSDTHILLCRLPNGMASTLKEHLARHYKYLIRDASNFQGLDVSCFRIAVQTPQENDALLHAIALFLDDSKVR